MPIIPRWTPEEDKLAKALVALGGSKSSMNGKIPGRSGNAIYSRVLYLAMNPEKRERMNLRKQRGWADRAAPKLRKRPAPAGVEPPPEVVADALRRAAAPMSVTAYFCKDPEPGRRWPDGRSAPQVSA